MKILLVISILILSCSTPKEKVPPAVKNCMSMIKDTKIKAPMHIEYYGIFSNIGKGSVVNNNGYTLRIVKDKNECQALIMDYLSAGKPNVWSFSETFNCNLNQIVLSSDLAFSSPYKDNSPIKRKFSFKGHILKSGHLKGAIIFDPDNEWNKESIQIVTLKRKKIVDKEMAGFDWEVIKKMKLKARCFR